MGSVEDVVELITQRIPNKKRQHSSSFNKLALKIPKKGMWA